MHHSIFGRYGADKDDTSLVLTCILCHIQVHAHKHGELNKKAIEIGRDNFEKFEATKEIRKMETTIKNQKLNPTIIKKEGI